MKTTGIVSTFLYLAKETFLNVSVLLALFWLPMEVWFRLSSWTLSMPARDLVNDVAMMVLLLVLVSAAVAMLVGGTGALIAYPFQDSRRDVSETVSAVIAIGILMGIVTILLRMLKYLLQGISGLSFSLGAAKPLLPLLAFGVVAVWTWTHGLKAAGNAIQAGLSRGRKAVLFLTLLAVITLTANGVALHDYGEIVTNPISPPRARMPNVILLSIDTLSAEDMSLYGYRLPTTPKLDAFARESFVFENFFSNSNWTLPSLAALVSGMYPNTSGVHAIHGYFLKNEQSKNLSAALKINGYSTAATVASEFGPLSLRISDSFSTVTERPVRKASTDRILDILRRLKNYQTREWLSDYLLELSSNVPVLQDDESPIAPAGLVLDRALSLIASLRQPHFTWGHIMPPHAPYMPDTAFKYRFGSFREFSTALEQRGYAGAYSGEQQAEVDRLRLRYDEFILDTDSRVGDFLAKLKDMGRFEDSIIVVTSDHGESFTKNHVQHGGPHLHQQLIHVPLLIHLPGQKEGRRISFYAEQIDLLPTVMDLLDLPIPRWAEGESLKAAMLEGKPTSKPKFSMNLDRDSRFAPPTSGTVAVMQDGWKLVRYLATGKEELYHLASDPRETTDLAASNAKQTSKMRSLIYSRMNLFR